MPKDTPMPAPILDDLLTLARDAVAPAESVLASATTRVRDAVSEGGRVSGAKLEEHQSAAHALAWLATYVEALRQMQKWAEKLTDEGRFGEMEQLIHQIAFGEYLWQIYGGIPMSQGEIARLQDLGLTQDNQRALMSDAVMTLTQRGNSQAARMRLVALMQENAGHATFGASGLDEGMALNH